MPAMAMGTSAWKNENGSQTGLWRLGRHVGPFWKGTQKNWKNNGNKLKHERSWEA